MGSFRSLRHGLWLCTCVLGFHAPAQSTQTVYTWTDDRGEVHFTNDPQSPPGDTVLRPVQTDDVSVVATTRPPAPPPPTVEQQRSELELRRLDAEARRAEADAERAKSQALRALVEAEAYWRESFRDARRKITLLRDAIEREQTILETSGLPITAKVIGAGQSCAYPLACAPAREFEQAKVRLRQLQRDLAGAEEELTDLERRASHAEVPREWRS